MLVKKIKDWIIPKIGTENQKDREVWLEKTLKAIPPGSKILDAGAGELKYKKYCSHLDYTSQDFGSYDGAGNSKGLQTKEWDNSKLDIVSDITNIPVKDKSFDTVMCIEVFEHIPEPVKAVKEFNRTLKPGGKLILTAPFCSLTHFAPYHFSSGYNKYWYEKVLTENNFVINEILPNGNYFEYLAQELRRLSYVEKKYTNLKLSKKNINKFYQLMILRMLSKLSKNDKGSENLLNFGFNVLATKK